VINDPDIHVCVEYSEEEATTVITVKYPDKLRPETAAKLCRENIRSLIKRQPRKK